MFEIEYGSIFSKVISRENLTVRQSKAADTAYFDIKKRELVLPYWNVAIDTYKMCMIHEVAHAIYTPIDYVRAIKAKPSDEQEGFGMCLNVVEDCRIDKMINRRYPGAITYYYNAQNELFDKDFFKIKGRTKPLNTGDKVNILFKTKYGNRKPNIILTNEEQAFVEELEKLETFDEVLVAAQKLYDMIKEDIEKQQQEGSFGEKKKLILQESDGDDQESSDTSNIDLDEFDEIEIRPSPKQNKEKKESSDKSNKKEESKEYNKKEESKEYNKKESSSKKEDSQEKDTSKDTSSLIEKAIKKGIKVSVNIETYKNFMQSLSSSVDKTMVQINSVEYDMDQGKNFFKRFIRRVDFKNKSHTQQRIGDINKNSLSTFISTFERKKAAKDLKRTQESRTGMLDMKKLHSYTILNDIFKSNEVSTDSKNHGIFLLIDFSGSMDAILTSVLKQVFILASFCKKVQIPFEIYAFTSIGSFGADFMGLGSNFGLFKIADNKMKIDDIHLSLSKAKSAISLGGTPLSQSIVVSYFALEEFKQKNKVDICNFILLSDGSGDNYYSNAHIFSKKEGYRIPVSRSFIGVEDLTTPIFKLMRTKLGVRVHTYYLMQSNRELDRLENMHTNIPKHKKRSTINTLEIEGAGEASYNWYLTDKALDDMVFTRNLADKIS